MHLYCGADVHADGLERIAGDPCWQSAATAVRLCARQRVLGLSDLPWAIRSRSPLGVTIVVLLRFDIGSDGLGRRQPRRRAHDRRRRDRDDGPRSTLPSRPRKAEVSQPMRSAFGALPAAVRRLRRTRRGRRHCRRSCPDRRQGPKYPFPFLLLNRRRAYDAGRRGAPFHKLRHAHSLFGFPPAHPNPPKRARTTGQVVRYLNRTYRLLPTAALGTACEATH